MYHTGRRFKYCNCSEIPSLARTEDYHFNNRQLHHLPYRSKAPLHFHSIQVTEPRCWQLLELYHLLPYLVSYWKPVVQSLRFRLWHLFPLWLLSKLYVLRHGSSLQTQAEYRMLLPCLNNFKVNSINIQIIKLSKKF